MGPLEIRCDTTKNQNILFIIGNDYNFFNSFMMNNIIMQCKNYNRKIVCLLPCSQPLEIGMKVKTNNIFQFKSTLFLYI